jgi:hypothetical protein
VSLLGLSIEEKKMVLALITIIPAHGRDYETEAQALEDWNKGTDFRIVECDPDLSNRWIGRYISKRDATGSCRSSLRQLLYCESGVQALLRYNKLKSVAIV